MKISREKILEMWALFEKLSGEKNNVKFYYTILKNKKVIEPEVEILKSANEAPEKHQEFEQKRLVLCGDFCEKDDDGKPEIEGNNFVILPEKRSDFEGKLEALKEEYKEMFDKIEASQKEFDELLNEEIEVEFSLIPMSTVPKELVGQDVETLFDLIDENA